MWHLISFMAPLAFNPGPLGFDANANQIECLEARLQRLRELGGETVQDEMGLIRLGLDSARFLGRTYIHNDGALVPQLLTATSSKPEGETFDSVVVSFIEGLSSQGSLVAASACTEMDAVL